MKKNSHGDEHPLPIRRNLSKHSREKRPKEAAHRRRRPKAPQRNVAPAARRHHERDGGDAVGHEQAAADAGERAHGDEGDVVGRPGVGEGEEREDHGAGEEGALVAVDCAEAAAYEDEGTLCEA